MYIYIFFFFIVFTKEEKQIQAIALHQKQIKRQQKNMKDRCTNHIDENPNHQKKRKKPNPRTYNATVRQQNIHQTVTEHPQQDCYLSMYQYLANIA